MWSTSADLGLGVEPRRVLVVHRLSLPAIDGDGLAVDRGGVVAGEPEHGARHFLDRDQPALRVVLVELGGDLLARRGRSSPRSVPRRRGRGRCRHSRGRAR